MVGAGGRKGLLQSHDQSSRFCCLADVLATEAGVKLRRSFLFEGHSVKKYTAVSAELEYRIVSETSAVKQLHGVQPFHLCWNT